MSDRVMNRTQRVVLILYCLLLIYCCVWIPWHCQIHDLFDMVTASSYRRMGYGWLWAGPITEEHTTQRDYAAYATPDLPLIQLRLIAATAISAAAFLLAGIQENSATRN